ncbi:hypothetical protein KKH43_06440 [Patescibacteria group bacterium]|nr:hypothetical protein [Patescibacteria group bacterium]
MKRFSLLLLPLFLVLPTACSVIDDGASFDFGELQESVNTAVENTNNQEYGELSIDLERISPDEDIISKDVPENGEVEQEKSVKPQTPPREGYTVSTEEISAFYEAIKTVFDIETVDTIHKDLEELKKRYPEGYYVVIKVGTSSPETVKQFYDQSIEEPGNRMNLLVHELTHMGSNMCFVSGAENTASCMLPIADLEKYAFFIAPNIMITPFHPDRLHTKDELQVYVKDFNTEFDNLYLQKEMGTIFGTLDELNSYTKSIRTELAYSDVDHPAYIYFEYSNVLRTIYHLAQSLYHAKHHDPETWNYLTSNKSVAYAIYFIKSQAEGELAHVDTSKYTDPIYADTTREIHDSKRRLDAIGGIFDEYFAASGLTDQEKSYDLTNEHLREIGIEVTSAK